MPSLPTSTLELARLVCDPDVEIQDLKQAVERDPGTAGNLLRLANSAYFGGRRQIATVRDAIVRLGLRQVAQLVLGSSVAPMARPSIKGYDLPAGGLLRHSVSTAACTEELAKALGHRPPHESFTAGLLHDVGKIVLGTFIEIDVKPILSLSFEESVPFQEAERRVLGIDHAEVGAVLLDEWGLPESLVEVIRWHHEPDEFTGDESLALDLVHVADNLARMTGMSTGLDGLHYASSNLVVGRLGITTEIAELVVCRVITGLSELDDLFGHTY
jgi:putative nucleotidyltransferase with HDIG domain